MSRYIDADELMLRINMHGTNKFGMLDEDIREFINNLPTADVRENVHGRWVENGTYLGKLRFKCSACQEDMAVSTVMLKPIWNFCPNCGADMREGGEDGTVK